MNIANYIVLDAGTKLKRLQERNSENYRWTCDGVVLFPIGTILPVIIRGERCIGTAVVRECHMRQSTTTVFFEMTETSQGKDAYNLFYANWALQAVLNGDEVDVTAVHRPSGRRSNAGNLNFSRRRHDDDDDDERGEGLTDEDIRSLWR